jgi:hypothetical protein
VTRRRTLVLGTAAVAGAAALVLVGVRPLGDDPVDLLPNLDAAAPGALEGRTDETTRGRRFYLGFGSAAGNIGDGPLVLDAERSGPDQPVLGLAQEIRRSDGELRSIELDETLRYVVSPDHSHWHLLGFMRYELRPAGGGRALRDRKTGFCLGDRHRLGIALPRGRSSPAFTDECGKNKPDLLALRVGISVGFGDDYAPNLEGQEFDVTDLPAGRYLLLHHVNPERVLLETDYGDNVSSMAFRLAWPRGRGLPPSVDVIERCPNSSTCG